METLEKMADVRQGAPGIKKETFKDKDKPTDIRYSNITAAKCNKMPWKYYHIAYS